MGRKKLRERITIEWTRRLENIGVITTHPQEIIQNYIHQRNIGKILTLFWNRGIKIVSLLDFCAYTMYWWIDKSVIAARTSWLKHPKHHSSEYFFDKTYSRLKLEIRQPDLDGVHWRTTHIHLVFGDKDAVNCCNIRNPMVNMHIQLIRPDIQGKYICRIK